MKLLTICIPLTGEKQDVQTSIDSCLLLTEEVEVLLIDSKESEELSICGRDYETRYPETVRVVERKDNDTILKTSLQYCKGLYYKLLESGDYFDQPSMVSVVHTIRDFIRVQTNLDVLITNYRIVLDDKKPKKVTFKNIFPKDTIFKWHKVNLLARHFLVDLSAIVVKTSILKNIQEDITQEQYSKMLTNYAIIPEIKSMYYLSAPFYNQTKETVLSLDEVDGYIELMKKAWDLYNVYDLKSRRQRKYMINMLTKIYTITQYLIYKNNLSQTEIDAYLYEKQPKLFKTVTYHITQSLFIIPNNKFKAMIIYLFEKGYGYHVDTGNIDEEEII